MFVNSGRLPAWLIHAALPCSTSHPLQRTRHVGIAHAKLQLKLMILHGTWQPTGNPEQTRTHELRGCRE
eukprot:2662226-Amphidinium_carterae.1